MIRVVEYVSECDVREISEPLAYDAALERLRDLAQHRNLDQLDLINVDTGRFVSWVI